MCQLHYDEHSDQYFNTHAGSVVATAFTVLDTTPKVPQLQTRFPLFSVIKERQHEKQTDLFRNLKFHDWLVTADHQTKLSEFRLMIGCH